MIHDPLEEGVERTVVRDAMREVYLLRLSLEVARCRPIVCHNFFSLYFLRRHLLFPRGRLKHSCSDITARETDSGRLVDIGGINAGWYGDGVIAIIIVVPVEPPTPPGERTDGKPKSSPKTISSNSSEYKQPSALSATTSHPNRPRSPSCKMYNTPSSNTQYFEHKKM
mmetsp:Transcript_22063/g.53410  ORF Transcript_22063/g.53410 Transcript_22063/m.53410 type:complete len:168 (+) Transcript_22063:437-940(+)